MSEIDFQIFGNVEYYMFIYWKIIQNQQFQKMNLKG